MRDTEERISIYEKDELKKITNKTIHALIQEAELGNYTYPGFTVLNLFPTALLTGNKRYCKWDCCFRPVKDGEEYCKEHYRQSIYDELGYTPTTNMYNNENLSLYMD